MCCVCCVYMFACMLVCAACCVVCCVLHVACVVFVACVAGVIIFVVVFRSCCAIYCVVPYFIFLKKCSIIYIVYCTNVLCNDVNKNERN